MTGFYLKKKGILAFGLANAQNKGFIVCAGSNIRNRQAGNMSVYRKRAYDLRNRLIRNGVISESLIFLTAYEFKNMSEATSVILGGSRSGDGWVNAKGQSYPEWANPSRRVMIGPIYKRGSRFMTNNNESFLISQVVANLDEHNNKIYEYLIRPKGGGKESEYLVPETALIKSLKLLIYQETRGAT